MKAKTICPYCKIEVIEECYGCIQAGTLVHFHEDTEEGKDGSPDIYENIKWEIIGE